MFFEDNFCVAYVGKTVFLHVLSYFRSLCLEMPVMLIFLAIPVSRAGFMP